MAAKVVALILPFLGWGIAGADPLPEGGGPKPPGPKVRVDGELAGHIRKLGDDRYQSRIEAQEALLTWGLRDVDRGIDLLFGLYRASEDPEIRLRSREVLKRLVIQKQPWDGNGYLGIQMEPAQVKNAAGELQPAVRVTQVREGTGAEEAGLQVGDLITGVDAIVFNDLLPTRMFSDYIQSKEPGDQILVILRRGREELRIPAKLRRRSPLLDQQLQWGNQLVLPEQSELDEADFREWLRKQVAAEKALR